MEKQTQITVEATINAPVQKVWDYWTAPQHIIQWNAASEDWHTTKAENELKPGGKFSARMEAKDGSFGFDFGGVYDEVEISKRITYTMDDKRKVSINFSADGAETTIVETFDAENTNAVEMQKEGWQAILNNFKNYTEEN